MNGARSVQLDIRLESESDLSPSDFTALFKYTEEFVRAIAYTEAEHLLEFLEVPEQFRLHTLNQMRRYARRDVAPAEIREIERGSWEVVAYVSAPFLIWFLKNYIHPVAREAWDDSQLRDRLYQFMRDRIFGGAAESVEGRAERARPHGNLRVTQVEALTGPEERDQRIRIELVQRPGAVQVPSADEVTTEFIRVIEGE